MTRRSWLRNVIASRTPRTIRKTPARHQLFLEALEDRCLLSGVDPVVPTTNLIPDITKPNSLFWNGGSPFTTYGVSGITVPPTGPNTMKTITITNTSSQTIYPFLRDANTGADPQNAGLSPNNPQNLYDPQDFNNQEYREYVGYVGTNGTDYLGLPAGASITLVVPLVFWDSGRLIVGTDGSYLTPKNPNPPGQTAPLINNPFNYDSNAQEAISVSGTTNSWVTQYTPDSNGISSAGLVMFYHLAGPQGAITASDVNPGAPAQLTEYTIRDPYLKTAGMDPAGGWLNDPAQTKVIFGYNISNVDNLTAPLAMEVDNVPVPIPGNTNPPTPNYGWIGTQLTSDQMQLLISSFVNNTPNTTYNGMTYKDGPLGSYFATTPAPNVNGPGWPSYNGLPGGVLKIPGGDNIFLNSPLNGQPSIYNTYGPLNQTLLSSGGTAPLSAGPGAATSITSQTQTTFNLSFPQDGVTQAAWFQNLTLMNPKQNEVDVTVFPATDTGLPPLVVGTVTDFNNSPTNPTITLSLKGGSIPADYVGTTPGLTLTRPVTDYAATRIRDLWYSWANFYHDQFSFTPFQAPGSVAIQGTGITQAAVLTLNSAPNTPLAVGMTVTDNNGILPTNAGPVTILRVIDSTHAYLSQFPTNQNQGGSGTFTLGPPPYVPFGDPQGINSITINNSGLGYKPATVTFTGGSGSGATGTLITSNGMVTGVAITNPGSGYTSAAPTVNFFGGTGASGTAVIQNGQVVGVTNIVGGSGYLSVDISGTGSGATAVAVVDPVTGKITNIIVTNTGTGYTGTPTVTISGGGSPTTTATATANVGAGFTKLFSTLTQDPNLPFSPTQFAASVYEVMEAEAGSPNFMLNQPMLPGSMSLVHYVIGAITNTLPNSNGGASMIGRLVTNLIISTLDGVPDYTNPAYQSSFYPAPATGTSGQPFNVYSLDPYVWFVHDVLNMSGYGFSVDDGSSFVNAQGSDYAPTLTVPNNLQVVFSGIGNLPNQQQWYPSTPYGTVQTVNGQPVMATITNQTVNGQTVSYLNIQNATDPSTIQAFWEVNANDPSTTGHVGAYAWASPIKPGTFLIARNVGITPTNPTGLQFQLSQLATPTSTPFQVTFTGANKAPLTLGSPPSPPPSAPPPSAPPPSNVQAVAAPTVTLTPVQEVVSLTDEQLLLTLTQFVFLLEQALGLPADPALVSSLAAYQDAINANPFANTLLGQEVINLTNMAILNLLTGGLP
jgi:hypothetical protein